MLKKTIKLIVCFIFALFVCIPDRIYASDEIIFYVNEDEVKSVLVNSFPDKFEGLDAKNILDMTLDEVENRAGSYTKFVANGSYYSQDNVFLGKMKDATWARSSTGVIDILVAYSVSASFGVSQTWNGAAAVNANLSFSSTSSITHHVGVPIGQIGTVGVFGQVSAQEGTIYIYENTTDILLATQRVTQRSVRGLYYDGIYDGQRVQKFYRTNYIINKNVLG